jgi:hypothetical protein
VSPRFVKPGEPVEIKVTTDVSQQLSATYINVHIDLVGELPGHGYAISSLSNHSDGNVFTGEVLLRPNQALGIMEIRSLVFVSGGQPLVMVPGKDFSPQYFKITNGVVYDSEAEDLDTEAASLYKQREKEFLSGWGRSGSPHNVYVFYRNCLARSGDIVFRKAKIFKMRGLAGEDMLDSIETFFATRINMPLKFQDRTQINARFIQSTPCIAILFPNVRAQSAAEAYELVKIPALHASLLMAADTGSAPEFIAAGIFSDVQHQWLFNVPRYPGNVLSTIGPIDYFMSNRFDLLNDRPEVRFYFALYRDAIAEQNADLAYFRYWTFLETVARNKGFKKGEAGVSSMLREHGTKFNTNIGIISNGKGFSADRCISVWAARRNITAHFGAFDPSSIQQKAERRSFDVPTSALSEILAQSHDFYLDHLKAIARLILNGLLSS